MPASFVRILRIFVRHAMHKRLFFGFSSKDLSHNAQWVCGGSRLARLCGFVFRPAFRSLYRALVWLMPKRWAISRPDNPSATNGQVPYQLGYAGMIPCQDGPDQGLLHLVGYPVFNGRKGPSPIDRQTRPSRSRNG
jgi:hypothetical protein